MSQYYKINACDEIDFIQLFLNVIWWWVARKKIGNNCGICLIYYVIDF